MKSKTDALVIVITDAIFILHKSVCFSFYYLLTYFIATITFVTTIFINVNILGSQRCALPLDVPMTNMVQNGLMMTL